MKYALMALALTGCATHSQTYLVAAQVNHKVNSAMVYTTDAEQYGKSDVWAIQPASGKGDCEDFALTKIKHLQAQGVNATLGICQGRIGTHAVALVNDCADTWVLDNRINHLVHKQSYHDCPNFLPHDITMAVKSIKMK
jgi:predicted transglutaminase-like cysteine proteinase